MEFLKKIQKLSIRKRKIIFWILLSIFAIILTILYIKISKERIANINIDEIQKEFPKLDLEKSTPELKGFDLQEKLEELNIEEKLEELNIEEEVIE